MKSKLIILIFLVAIGVSLTSASLWDLSPESWGHIYCKLTGCTFTGNITSPYFLGKLSWSNLFAIPRFENFNTSQEIFEVVDNNTFLKSYSEIDPLWSANFTKYNTSWSTDTDTWADWRNSSMITFLNNTDDLLNFTGFTASKYLLYNGSDFDALYGRGEADTIQLAEWRNLSMYSYIDNGTFVKTDTDTHNNTYTGCGLNGVVCTFDDDTINTNKNISTSKDIIPATNNTGYVGRKILRWLEGWITTVYSDEFIYANGTNIKTLFTDTDTGQAADDYVNVTGDTMTGDLQVNTLIKSDDTVFIKDTLNVTENAIFGKNITLAGTNDGVIWNNGTHLRIGS